MEIVSSPVRKELSMSSHYSTRELVESIECMHDLMSGLTLHPSLDDYVKEAVQNISSSSRLVRIVVVENYRLRRRNFMWKHESLGDEDTESSFSEADENFERLCDPHSNKVSLKSRPKLYNLPLDVPHFDQQNMGIDRYVFPLNQGSNGPFGIVQFDRIADDEHEFSDCDFKILRMFADCLAFFIEHDAARRYQKKLLALNFSANVKLRDIEKKRIDAESANAQKSQFLANMSHEIRTPLGIILGFSDLLCREEMEAGDKEIFQNAVRKNGELLSKIIDDILDLAKIEVGKIEFEFRPFLLVDLLEDLMSTFSSRAREKNLWFLLEVDKNSPKIIRTDLFRLKQILINLINNALKFTSKGGVTIRVFSGPEVKGCHPLFFEVRDTGLGLCSEDSERLFQPFMQAKTSTSSQYGGTGLGLVLAKKLAQGLGGDVVLRESVEGRGSVFECHINSQRIDEIFGEKNLGDHDEAQEFEKTLAGIRILLADDALDNLLLFTTVLKAHGAEVDTAMDGCEVIEKVNQKSYDILLLDLQMPVKDGFTTARDLRVKGFDRPILALTAMAMSDEKERAISAGCNDHLSKPVLPENLVLKILELHRQSSYPAEASLFTH